ncbi:bacterial alpha-l-rhamnosidase domain-containing protein [Colletotrichum truncatum]|uniref:Bacterial alpha-l-rhamnosidase domain-containing protein n=1 Tax=Colletotrichum truncatum TaxID=5467 RepID=A0ACC3ZLX9_COLTU|nr:bacterial alpha-l-rhamnosidase domain-containing protein [Colletotrichum truncatum]KAF6783988.1 bacterial alpha-l-rhamnosidase domain-containing protein [Colletotrichum truncatum]
MPNDKDRGGFRYLTLFQTENSVLNITDVTLEIGFQPTCENLRAYKGYFHSNDQDLNEIWYSGANTLQTNCIARDTGRRLVCSVAGWGSSVVLGTGDTFLVDRAKRDRWFWPVDMGVAVPAAFVSTGEMESTRNSLQSMFDAQSDNGELPYSGQPRNSKGSDMYHMWSLVGTYNYVWYTGDINWLKSIWPMYQKALDFTYNKVTGSGLLHVDRDDDWGRYVNQINGSAPNMLLYRTLISGARLANYLGSDLGSTDSAQAKTLSQNNLTHFWDETKGAFTDTPGKTGLWPQDSNSMAVVFGVVEAGSSYAQAVATYLTRNWTPIGSKSPGLPRNIFPFTSSIEIEAHFKAGRGDRADELIRSCCGWYLNNPNGTQSTVIEGYLQDGSFGYRDTRGYRNDKSYISHSHGWSAGPTSALAEYLVGLQVEVPAGLEWRLKPVFAGVTEAQAGFTTLRGKFQAKWSIKDGQATVAWDFPLSTKGWIGIPGIEPFRTKGKEYRKVNL